MCVISSWVTLSWIQMNHTGRDYYSLSIFCLSRSSLVYTPFTNCLLTFTVKDLLPLKYIKYTNPLYYWCKMALTPRFVFGQTIVRTVAWTIEPDAWWELSLWGELFRSHKKLKRCGGFFLMSLVLLWQFIRIGKILLHWC